MLHFGREYSVRSNMPMLSKKWTSASMLGQITYSSDTSPFNNCNQLTTNYQLIELFQQGYIQSSYNMQCAKIKLVELPFEETNQWCPLWCYQGGNMDTTYRHHKNAVFAFIVILHHGMLIRKLTIDYWINFSWESHMALSADIEWHCGLRYKWT